MYTLITNLQFIAVQGIRLYCNALLISKQPESDKFLALHSEVRGFGTEPSSEHFGWHLDNSKHFPFAFNPGDSVMAKVLSRDGAVAPLFTGSKLVFADSSAVDLVAMDGSKPIDVQEIGGDIQNVWEALPDKVVKYWNLPNIPLRQFVSVKLLRPTTDEVQAMDSVMSTLVH